MLFAFELIVLNEVPVGIRIHSCSHFSDRTNSSIFLSSTKLTINDHMFEDCPFWTVATDENDDANRSYIPSFLSATELLI